MKNLLLLLVSGIACHLSFAPDRRITGLSVRGEGDGNFISVVLVPVREFGEVVRYQVEPQNPSERVPATFGKMSYTPAQVGKIERAMQSPVLTEARSHSDLVNFSSSGSGQRIGKIARLLLIPGEFENPVRAQLQVRDSAGGLSLNMASMDQVKPFKFSVDKNGWTRVYQQTPEGLAALEVLGTREGRLLVTLPINVTGLFRSNPGTRFPVRVFEVDPLTVSFDHGENLVPLDQAVTLKAIRSVTLSAERKDGVIESMVALSQLANRMRPPLSETRVGKAVGALVRKCISLEQIPD